jgi:chromosome segregation ATPase
MEFTTPEEQLAHVGEQAQSVEDHGEGALGEVERALSEKEAELAKLASALDERLALADAQKAEIVAGGEQAKSVEDHGDAAVGEVERALSEKEAELAKLTNALDERSALADAQKAEIVAGVEQAKSMEDRGDAAVGEVWRALSKRGTELVKLTNALDECSALADAQKAEIAALMTQIETLKERLAEGGNEAIAVDDHRGAAVRDAEGALSEKEAELIKLRSALDERSALADAQKAEIVALTTQIKTLKERLAQGGNEVTAVDDQGDATVRDAERALSEKEAELAKLRSALDECSVTADLQKTEIVVLKVQVQTLQARLSRAGEEAKELQDRYNAAERALTEKEAELDKLRSTHDEGSVAAESHKAEIVALSRQIGTLKKQLIRVTEEARAEREQRDAASIELKSVTQKLNEFVRQTADERAIGRRAQQELESRLAEQSRLLNESEFELDYLRSEAESTRQAEADLRIAIIEIDSRAHAAAQDFKVEKARLQAALERANGERARLSYELAEMKRRVEDSRVAERVENFMLSGAP